LDERAIYLLFLSTLAGDASIFLWLTTSADRIDRRRMLLLGALASYRTILTGYANMLLRPNLPWIARSSIRKIDNERVIEPCSRLLALQSPNLQ